MSDKQDEKEPQGTPSPDPQGSTADPQGSDDKPQPDPPKADVDWQAEARKWEQRAKKDAKATAELRDQVKRLVDPDQAAEQVRSVEEQVQAVTQERDSALVEARRWKIGVQAGLTYDDIDQLLGVLPTDDEDTLAARAKHLAERVTRPAVGTPHAKVGAGENGDSPPLSWQQQVAEAERAGDWQLASKIKTAHLLEQVQNQ